MAGISKEKSVKKRKWTVALAGNPNVGKSTVFNALTGMKQHTGNWPGKTVSNATGTFFYGGEEYTLVDVPGAYSLLASSAEEEIARDYICFGDADCICVVVDATCLERNLNLVLQILEVTSCVVVCVNLMDEAAKKGIRIDLLGLQSKLGVPVIGMTARKGIGLKELKMALEDICVRQTKIKGYRPEYPSAMQQAVECVTKTLQAVYGTKRLSAHWLALRLFDMDEALHSRICEYLREDPLRHAAILSAFNAGIKTMASFMPLRETIAASTMQEAEHLYRQYVQVSSKEYDRKDRWLDRLFTSRITGIPAMLLLLALILWITIVGANYPSAWLSTLFGKVGSWLSSSVMALHSPAWLHDLLIEGVYGTVSWVVSVMLPPMAIFFPLFTLLEDVGYLPRVAFNLDRCFRCAGAHGKQVLSMCMGLGCNACGVMGCRIIESPKERLIAILTNSLVPCNGKFPALITLIGLFFVGKSTGGKNDFAAALTMLGVLTLAVGMTLLISKVLSLVLKGERSSSFVLELPPYRMPQVGKVLVRSIFDRTLFVLGRAVSVAVPAGILIWLVANVYVGGQSLLAHCANALDPLGKFFGMDGMILLAFALGFPANEIVIPILIMGYMNAGTLSEVGNVQALVAILQQNGWTFITVLCTAIFMLFHFPCGTTCSTVYKETKSLRWTAAAFVIPLLAGLSICAIIANFAKIIG